MAFKNDKGDKPAAPSRDAALESFGTQGRSSPGVGDALRTAYQRTVEEDVPQEMLDLLGKLG